MTLGGTLGIVPARLGSKGIPRKNLKPLQGRPLLEYAVECARSSGVVDRLILSTEADEIAAVGHGLGVEVPFVRPPHLARDDTPMLDVVKHAVEAMEGIGYAAEVVLLLQPTSPLRRPEHLVEAVRILRATGADAVVSVVPLPDHLSPDYLMRLDDGKLVPFLPRGSSMTRRQDARRAYRRDGTVYAFWARTLKEKGSLYGDDARPLVLRPEESVTIDTLEDWDLAERCLATLEGTGAR